MKIFLLILLFAAPVIIKAQAPAAQAYPKVTGYLSVASPVIIFDKNGGVFNGTNYYALNFPCGINILKSDRLGYSFELAPILRFAGSTSKTSQFLFHPGIMFRRQNGFTIITRLAFETGGRYGTTVVFNKIFYRTAMNSYWFSVPVPFRFGNNAPASAGVGIQLGVTF